MVSDAPLRLRIDGDALAANWRWLRDRNPAAACGAAVKADGYGLGAQAVVDRLAVAGCRDFFVATWDEARSLRLPDGCALSVLHGVRAADMADARPDNARPVLNSPEQVRRWRDAGGGACDVMVDTGINRLGASVEKIGEGLLDGLEIETLMSHLACADEDSAMNEAQRARFADLAGRTGAGRMSLANSAGTMLGSAYAFDLVRPGLALYGGRPRGGMEAIRQVAFPEAQVLQRRRVAAGETVGYNALWTAPRDSDVAILNIGYADGYWRGFTNNGTAEGGRLPVIGRVSMDLTAIDITDAPNIAEGDWVKLDYDLPAAAAASGMSQYELLTGLGRRFDRPRR